MRGVWMSTGTSLGGAAGDVMISAALILAASRGAASTSGAAARIGLASTSNSASGCVPVTDCTNAMVCAIRRSRSFFQLITHLGPGYLGKKPLRKQDISSHVRQPTLEAARPGRRQPPLLTGQLRYAPA